jgi:CRP-like cAMP-binding protein
MCIDYSKEDIIELKQAAAEDDKNFSPAMIQLIKIKDKINFFKNLNDLEVKSVISNIEFKKLKKGEIVLKEGEKSEEIYYILYGNLNVVVGRKVVGKLTTGQVFGEIASLVNTPRTATVRATEDTQTIVFKLAFKEYDTYPRAFAVLFKNFTLDLVKKLETSNKK